MRVWPPIVPAAVGTPDRGSGLGEGLAEVEERVRLVAELDAGLAQRDAPVAEKHFAERADHDVFGLDVAMGDAAGVGEFDRIGDAAQDVEVNFEPTLVGVGEQAGDMRPFDAKDFARSLVGADSVTATFQDVTRSGDGLYYFRWVMDMRLKKVARGKTLRSPGISVVRFDAQGRVLIHQDYWDSSTGFFEHVPVVGWGSRAIKARL